MNVYLLSRRAIWELVNAFEDAVLTDSPKAIRVGFEFNNGETVDMKVKVGDREWSPPAPLRIEAREGANT